MVDFDYTILGGNQRHDALIVLKNNKVEITRPNRKLSTLERKKVTLLDNLHKGDFDLEILNQEFEKEMLLDMGFSEYDLEEEAEQDFEDFDTDESLSDTNARREMIFFLFNTKEEKKAVLDLLKVKSNKLEGKVLLNLLQSKKNG